MFVPQTTWRVFVQTLSCVGTTWVSFVVLELTKTRSSVLQELLVHPP